MPKIPIKVKLAAAEHQVAYQDLAALIRKHADKVDAEGLLAIAANMVGKLVAMQDQRTMTPEMAMVTVAENVAAGNAEMIELLGQTKGNA
jgi:hypothetical protein